VVECACFVLSQNHDSPGSIRELLEHLGHLKPSSGHGIDPPTDYTSR
jgi:hypothetical protein